MQIQRFIEESMGVCKEVKADGNTMKNPKHPEDSAEPAESTKPVSPDSAANSSFLHRSERVKSPTINERSMNDRIVYATIDRLALKRARLPLQLVPIDDNTSAVEKKEKINADKRANASRKTSPRRPSFKVRPGIPVSGSQWKSRNARSSSRSNQANGKYENVSKELVSRLIIFENIIRNNNNCERFDERTTPAETVTDQEVPILKPETKASRDKHSKVIHTESFIDPGVEKEIADGAETPQEEHSLISPESSDTVSPANRAESNDKDSRTKDESQSQQSTSLNLEEVIKITEENDEFFEPIETDISTSQKHLLESCSTSTSSSSLSSKTKRYKPEFTFAKNVLNYVPISSQTKRTKKSSSATKNRKNEANSNLQSSKSKSFSREELRHSISLPMNFVHLASATNSKLLPNGETDGNSSGKIITHKEKCAKLEYLGTTDYQDIVIAKVNEKIVRNSCEDRTTYVEIKQKTPLNFTETRRSVNLTVSSADCLFGVNGKDVDNYVNRAKVGALENSQGVPEVVKRSENEGNDKYEEKTVEEDTTAPVYEAMSEFSISNYGASASAASAGLSTRVNASFLWGGRAISSNDKFTTSCKIKDEIIASGHETYVKHDNSIEDDGYDAYDDVGLSRDDTEEDHYDDVGLPSTVTKNSSTDTIFEEINVELYDDDELYDDVLPGPISKNSTSSTNSLNCNNSDSTAIKRSNSCGKEITKKVDSPLVKRLSNLSGENLTEESYENQYLSISNDYSSVEEGLNDFEGEEDDGLYDDVELPSQERVNSLYAGSCSGSQLGSLYNGKESEWEDLEEAAPEQPLSKKNVVVLRHGDSQTAPNKKKSVHRWSRKVRRQKSKASRKNPASRAASTRGTSTFSVAVSLGTGTVLLVGSNDTTSNDFESLGSSNHARLPPDSTANDKAEAGKETQQNSQLHTRGLVQLRILGKAEDSIDTQETSCYVLEDTASDDSNYETLFSFPSDEFSSGSEDDDSSTYPSAPNTDDTNIQIRVNGISPEAPSRPVPPPPRESSLTETFGKQIKMLRRTWSITKGSLGRMRRRTSTVAETDTNIDDSGKYGNSEQQQIQNNDGRKYFSFKKHFKKSMTGLSTFYLENENNEDRLSRNNNFSKDEVYSDSSNNSWYTNTDYWKTGVNEQSQRNDVDHYSMLDEEPLYQFYAAAAARVAFESDSEGYEEVEDPTPSPSTVDLAKPGHRTLWCQTPQVINSALLQRLTSDEKKMQEAKFEIFTSEASYLNSLRVLVDEFLNDHELVHDILTPNEREKLFGGVPSVLLASERLLAELETVWREDVMFKGLPEVLLNYAQRSSSVYVAYCSNQVSIDTTLKELRNKKGSKFTETVRRIESHPACQSLSLHSFLMLPMQRVTRLPLLADAVLSKVSSENKDERTCWECVLSQLSQVVMECNEGARGAGRLAEMEALERKLEYSSKVPPIILRDRYLVRRGPVVQMLAKADAEYKLTFGKRHHKASLYLLLLTDYLLVAKPKPNTNEETYTVIDTCKRSLVALEKVTEDSPFAGRHAMVLSLLENYSGRHVEYILTCKNATERERWLDAVSPPKPSLVGETLYETWDCPQVMALYPYAAAQPDELTLQPGDVINVLRKMTDGWHLGEKLLGGEQGWFPGNYAKEVASEHVRARNLRQRHRLLALSASVLQQRAKQTSRLH